MSTKPLFSVVIPSYNQEKTIRESIHSVLIQDYPNLELIVSDDASTHFEKASIETYIGENRKENLKNYTLLTHEQNVGTVRNLNGAIRQASGAYVIVFAGDDCLFDENTLSNYQNSFQEHPEQNMITAQCHRYDSDLKEFLFKQVNLQRASEINQATAQGQFKMLSETNTFAMGATAFRREMLKQHNFFNERYKLIEDWSLFLKLTRDGERFRFVDFPALRHRYGGISKRKNKENLYALSSRAFCLDLLAVFEHEIFPYMRGFSEEEQNKRISTYMSYVMGNKELLANTLYANKSLVKLKLLLTHPLMSLRLFLKSRVK